MKSNDELTREVKEIILSNGFDNVGIARAERLKDFGYLTEWINNDFHADMKYMEDADRRSDIRKIDPSFKSVISCSLNYNSFNSKKTSMEANEDGKAWISKYAIGDDYHNIIKKKLNIISLKIKDLFLKSINMRVYVDTGPILERAYAVKSGLGWIGKNSCLINKKDGSWFFLSNILVDQELVYDDSYSKDFCGTCNKCIDSCPTDAIVSDKVIDSRKCISYLTIENKNYIKDELAKKFLNNIFGCDICQEVCPWNRKSPIVKLNELNIRSELIAPNVIDLLGQIEKNWDEIKIKSPLKRVKKDGLIRNILIAMGNLANKEYIPILKKYLNSKDVIHSNTAKDSILRIEKRINS